ncbi:hypothetical protein IDJ77_14885 [Mucilaginibacter sp. ZT4R22]|uniref:Repeat protein (TIGR03806 family) n=1 Tax=Mucilaginibacter pankratovii TaxID=2772110 RepID=A0ABR7WS27_9SPHI|nr:hypothetical protein [Mucilaginibacter pankratovii]MBD1365105.1 hypothetical protein [Mucilaginibacter pankratovii]
MKKFLVVVVIFGMLLACKYFQSHNASGLPNAFCDSTAADNPCSIIPYDVNESFGLGYDSFLDSLHQTPFDIFSWQTFIALNWPANAAGNPIGTSITDSVNAPRVWEHYQDPAEVFGTSMPLLNLRLGETKKSGQKFLYLDSKAPHNLAHVASINSNDMGGFQEADGHPLIDRNLNFALYEIKMNPVETKFTLDNQLTTTQGIYNAGIKTNNSIDLPQSNQATKNVGMIEIKASWRILLPAAGDDTSRYYCRKATIFIDSLHTRNHKPLLITNVTVGMVGMHIVRKTAKVHVNQIWTTFEHIDNTPDNAQEAQMNGRQWSFYNPDCLNCTPNAPADTIKGDNQQYLWEPNMPYARDYATGSPGQQSKRDSFGTQAMRVYPVYRYTELVNQQWQAKLKGTVWANYKLIGTQWEQSEIHPGPTAPNFLGNTTLETFLQADASCISCHRDASILYNNKKDTIKTDFSFIFPIYARVNTNARPAKK